ncbi:MAG: 30S ribosomal protein S19 [bacterium]|nr:30S ribosomal protein S19 [bacterium]
MSRSSKKGPYIDEKLMKKVVAQKANGQRLAIKTWARASQIPPEFVGHRFLVHTGRDFKEIFISEAMVGHRLGEFAPTRTFRGHGKIVKRLLEKT